MSPDVVAQRPTIATGSAFALLGILILLGLGAVLGWFISVDRIQSPSDVGLILVAVIVGVACFFNPCALPLFPALMANVYQTGGAKMTRAQAARLGFAGAGGVAAFMAVFGVIVFAVGEAGEAVMAGTPFRILRFVAGGALVFFGILLFLKRGGITIPWAAKMVPTDSTRPGRTLFTYGFVYTVLGLGCTAPILGGFIVANVAAAETATAFTGFLVASLVMALLMFATVFLVRSQRRIAGPWIERMHVATGAIFLLVGLFLMLEAAFPSIFNPIFHPWL